MNTYCLVCGQAEDAFNKIKLHCFPRDVKRASEWWHILFGTDYSLQGRTGRICSKHFTKSAFRAGNNLSRFATPSPWARVGRVVKEQPSTIEITHERLASVERHRDQLSTSHKVERQASTSLLKTAPVKIGLVDGQASTTLVNLSEYTFKKKLSTIINQCANQKHTVKENIVDHMIKHPEREDQEFLQNGPFVTQNLHLQPSINRSNSETISIGSATLTCDTSTETCPSPINQQDFEQSSEDQSLLVADSRVSNICEMEGTEDGTEEKCVICKISIAPNDDNAFNITTATIGRHYTTLQEFIVEPILNLKEGIIFDGLFCCRNCYDLFVQLDDYLTKTKDLQEFIINKYLRATNDISIHKPMEPNDDANYQEVTSSKEVLQESSIKKAPENNISVLDKHQNPSIKTTSKIGNRVKQQEVVHHTRTESRQKPYSRKTQELIDLGQIPSFAYRCKLCSKTFGSKDVFDLHMQVHNTTEVFNCYHCDKSFVQKENLQNHLYVHRVEPIPTEEDQLSCVICKKSFSFDNCFFSMNDHLNTVHPYVRKFSCNICDRPFVFKQNFECHMTSHNRANIVEGANGPHTANVLWKIAI